MELFNILIGQVEFFAVSLAVGFIAQRAGFLKNDTIDSLSRIMMKVIIPFLILTVVASSGSRSEIISSWPFIVCCFIMYGINALVGTLSGKIIRLKRPELNAHIGSVTFQNSAIFGFPIIMAMFPQKAGIYIADFAIVETILCWTGGVLVLSSGTGNGKIELKKMATPVTAALVVGVLMVFAGIRPENVVWNALTGIGATQKYLGLIYIGSDIGRKGFKRLFAKPKVFSTIPVKLIISPLILFFVLTFLGFADKESIMAITVFAMLPSMLVMTILAEEYKCAPDYAAGAILATTTACLFTMPFVFYIAESFGGR